jgi:hypothetical protein
VFQKYLWGISSKAFFFLSFLFFCGVFSLIVGSPHSTKTWQALHISFGSGEKKDSQMCYGWEELVYFWFCSDKCGHRVYKSVPAVTLIALWVLFF